MSGVLVLGASGHGKVVADILLCQGASVLGFLDDAPEKQGTLCLGLPILGPLGSYARFDPDGLVLAIGDNQIRRWIVERLGDQARPLWRNAIHPRATVAASVRVGYGIVIAAGAVINPDAVLGNHVIINTGATVDHDCQIEDYAHIAPGAHLAGHVQIGAGTLVGAGSAVIPSCTIGAWTVIGAGATVIRNIPERVTAKGVPADW